jgi:hypothetical protein
MEGRGGEVQGVADPNFFFTFANIQNKHLEGKKRQYKSPIFHTLFENCCWETRAIS